jgi:molybdopterin converting factor small subunit
MGGMRMAVVWIPSLLRDLTGGRPQVNVPGETVREVIAELEKAYPGIEARLCDGGQLRPHISVVVDGEVSKYRLRHRLTETSEVHFLPAISGG